MSQNVVLSSILVFFIWSVATLPWTPKGRIVILINPPMFLALSRSSSGYRFLCFLIIGRCFLGLLLNGNVPKSVGTLDTEKEPKCSTVVDFRAFYELTVVTLVA